MGTRIVAKRRCRCGAAVHPVYGGVCEDCWATAQPKEKHALVHEVRGRARQLITPALDGLYYWIVDDGATDPLPEPPRPDPALVVVLRRPPTTESSPLY